MRPWSRSHSIRTESQRGGVLLLAITFVTAIFFLSIGYLELVPSELRLSLAAYEETSAYLTADAGVVHALAWLEDRLQKGEEPGLRLASYRGRGELDNGWSWRVTIQPDGETAPRGNNPLRAYQIEAVAERDGQPRRRVTAQVLQQSFSRYAMFMDQWPSNIVYTLGTAGVDGPIHTNDIMRMNVPYQGYWKERNRDPMFLGEVTASKVFTNRGHGSAQDGIAYYRGNYSGDTEWRRPYGKDGPIAERYQRMVAGGRENLKTGVRPETLPSDSFVLAEAAWGQAEQRPSKGKQVYVNPNGGIYITGDVDTLHLGVAQGGNSFVTIEQGQVKTTVFEVTEAPMSIPAGSFLNGKQLLRSVPVSTNNTVTMENTGVRKANYQVTPGTPNGVVFATGDIEGLSGVNKGSRTIAVEVSNRSQIFLDGDLTQASTRPGDKPDSAEDTVGLVAYDVMVSRHVERNKTSQSRPLYIYAEILAGQRNGDGGFGVEDYNRGQSRGYMEIHGGISQSKLKPWAVLGGGGMSGQVYFNRHTDKSPPPYFPTIPKFQIRVYQEEPIR